MPPLNLTLYGESVNGAGDLAAGDNGGKPPEAAGEVVLRP